MRKLISVLSFRRLIVLLVALAIAGMLSAEAVFRHMRFTRIVDTQSLYRSAGYTGGLVFSFADMLFDSQGRTPRVIEALIKSHSIENGEAQLWLPQSAAAGPGLFVTNRDSYFWWFERDGKIAHENTFHLNNLGLISVRDFQVERNRPSFRVVVLGAELTAATTANKSWPDHLQDILNARAELAPLGPVEVINFGWPDADFAIFSRVWREKAKTFDPDLVLINIAEHLFDRMPNPTARGPSGPKYSTYWEPFAAPNGLRAWLIVTCYGDGRRLRDADCNTGRPFGLWLPKELAHDARSLGTVQDQIVFDYLGRLIWRDWRLTWTLALLGRLHDPLDVRTFKGSDSVTVIPPLTPEMKVQNASKRLSAILDDFPRTLMIVNRNYTELTPRPVELPMVTALSKANPRFRINDTAAYLPLDSGDVKTWYQIGIAHEKWSEKGHRVYAGAVAELVLRRLREDHAITADKK